MYSLQLTVLGDSYSLVGAHGSTPIIPWEPALGPPSCNSSVSSNTAQDGISPAFEQSTSQGPTTLTLVDNFFIPGRSECILEFKAPRGYSGQLGMVCPLEDSDNSPYFTAFTISKPVNSRILI